MKNYRDVPILIFKRYFDVYQGSNGKWVLGRVSDKYRRG